MTKTLLVLVFSLVFVAFSARAVASPVLGDSALIEAAKAEIDFSNSSGNTDTQCSDFVTKVLHRAGIQIPFFHSNDFDQIAPKYLPDWTPTEFIANDLAQTRAALKTYLNSYPDHTAFIAQWIRVGQSGHVAILEKIAPDSFVIYQAQGGLTLPHSSPVKVESLLYGTLGADRTHMKVFANGL